MTASLCSPSCAVRTQLHCSPGLPASRHCAPAPCSAGRQVATGGEGPRTGLPDSAGQSASPALTARQKAGQAALQGRPPGHCPRRPHGGSAALVSARFSPAAGRGLSGHLARTRHQLGPFPDKHEQFCYIV